MSFLDEILEGKREEIAALEASRPDLSAAPPVRDLFAALAQGPAPRFIAEVKRASPSEGPIRPDLDPVDTAVRYAAAGAAAISVLTDRRWFDGSLAALAAIRAAVEVPVLCKDFLVAPVQVDAARAAGADACLLIVAALPGDRLAELLACVRRRGMAALVEVHDAEERDRAVQAGATIVGVNSRDLHTFSVDLAVAERLVPGLPSGVVAVAESGLRGPDDAARMVRAGARACLVGTALVRSPDPGRELARWIASCG